MSLLGLGVMGIEAIGLDMCEGSVVPGLGFLVTLVRLSLGLALFGAVVCSLAFQSLSCGGGIWIDRSRLAIDALVDLGNLEGGPVETFNMLPCVALFAERGVAVIVGETTNTLDGVLFFVHFNMTEVSGRSGLLTEILRLVEVLRGSMVMEEGIVSHNPRDRRCPVLGEKAALGWGLYLMIA